MIVPGVQTISSSVQRIVNYLGGADQSARLLARALLRGETDFFGYAQENKGFRGGNVVTRRAEAVFISKAMREATQHLIDDGVHVAARVILSRDDLENIIQYGRGEKPPSSPSFVLPRIGNYLSRQSTISNGLVVIGERLQHITLDSRTSGQYIPPVDINLGKLNKISPTLKHLYREIVKIHDIVRGL